MKNTSRLLMLAGFATTLMAGPLVCAMAAPAAKHTPSQWRTFQAEDNTKIHYRYWPTPSTPKTVIQIVHGAAEHSGRYDELANVLVQHGYAVLATDHRGHGRTRVRSRELGDAGPDAWNHFVTDEGQLSQIIHATYPNADLVLLGHSLGSFIAQDYVTRFPDRIDALVMSGTAYDSAAPEEFLKKVRALLARYKELGLTRVTHHFYEGARHDVFNETKREQVQNDLLAWLKRVTPQ